MASIFDPVSVQAHGGSFKAENLTLQFANSGGGPGALVQQVNFTCTRQINMIYEIGSSNVYYVGNRRQGQAQMQRIVGGSADFKTIITEYGDMCKPQNLNMNANATACGGNGGGGVGVDYQLESATLTSVGASVSANDVVITESLGFMFLDLSFGGGAGGGGAAGGGGGGGGGGGF
jgi:hypothetical protein